jgi:hypothetical protein
MAEMRFTSTFDLRRERLLVVNSGLMRRIRDNVVLYANVGRSVLSDEGIRHIYLGVGVKFCSRQMRLEERSERAGNTCARQIGAKKLKNRESAKSTWSLNFHSC